MVGAIPSLSVEELKQKRDRGDSFVLVDVREPREAAISDLPGAVKIPLGTLPRSLDRLNKEDEIVVYCRSGARSGQAVQFLRQMGFARAKNLAGGINRWAEVIDPKMARY
jgi:adenylyltransferase/sulfurtransferase